MDVTSPTFSGVYENGVIRPIDPLPIANGTRVQVTLLAQPGSPIQPAVRQSAVAALDSLIGATDNDPSDEYDLLKALDENRFPGERKLYPEELKGITW